MPAIHFCTSVSICILTNYVFSPSLFEGEIVTSFELACRVWASNPLASEPRPLETTRQASYEGFRCYSCTGSSNLSHLQWSNTSLDEPFPFLFTTLRWYYQVSLASPITESYDIQVLMSSRWYGQPGQYAMRKTPMSTVGVLVYLDGSRSFRSWDGDMVRALVCFNVDGRLVRIASGHVPPSLAATVVGVAGVGNGEFDPERNAGNAPRSQHQQHQQQPPEDGPPPPPSPLPEASDAPSNLPPSWAAGGASEETAPWEVAAASAAMVPIGPPGGPGYKRDLGVAGRVGRGANSLRVPGAQGRGGGAAGGRGGGMPQVPAPGASAALGLALPKDRDLFPTVTIHSPNTEVRAYLFIYLFFCVFGLRIL